VRAVLFHSPSCPACHTVIDELLPPIVEQHPDQLQIVGIDVSQDAGLVLYQSAVMNFQVPEERVGVPTLVIAQHVLVGPNEISALLPGIIEQGLLQGGVDWPAIPGLEQALAQASPGGSSQNTQSQQVSAGLEMVDRFMLDPIANSIAIFVLVGMLISIVAVGNRFLAGNVGSLRKWPTWMVPALATAGLFIALYLSYVEISHAEAICGPVGNCNSVQQSPYAQLFGVIPVGLMGVFGYVAILAAWIMQQFGPKSLHKLSTMILWGLAWVGVLFSVYLTFLEPFVIGATCAWCVTSAVVMTLILWASTGPALMSMQIDEFDDEEEWSPDAEYEERYPSGPEDLDVSDA
jgi:uncharacterized membrane protein